MKLFEVENIKASIDNASNKIALLEEERNLKNKQLSDLEGEKDSLNERKDELYKILSNSEEFKADEYITNQLEKSTREYESLKESKNIYIKKVTLKREENNSEEKKESKKDKKSSKEVK